MTRHVYPTDELCHLWANGIDRDLRNSGGSVFTRGDTIYSYGHHFPMATKLTNEAGDVLYVVNGRSYSPTTNRHQSHLASAMSHLPQVTSWAGAGNLTSLDDHLKGYVERVAEYEGKHKRARAAHNKNWYAERIEEAKGFAKRLCEFHGRPCPDFGAAVAMVTERTERERLDRIDRLRQQAEAREARRLEVLASVPAWQAHEPLAGLEVSQWDLRNYLGHDALRLSLDGSEIETTRGARVPVAHARRIFGFIAMVRDKGEGWRNDGRSSRFSIGHYTLDRVTGTGDCYIGCHFIPWAEIARMAPLIGAREGWPPVGEAAPSEALATS